eukprot:COSAG01_NODE_638_length_14605_cov_46.266097_8_plen_115_part_00
MTGWDLPTVSVRALRAAQHSPPHRGYQFTDPRASDRPGADLTPSSQFQLLGGWRCSKIAPRRAITAIRGWWVTAVGIPQCQQPKQPSASQFCGWKWLSLSESVSTMRWLCTLAS